ncbi:hypothetical protein Hanom_Chr14g01248081 [Helianthus anomalus]
MEATFSTHAVNVSVGEESKRRHNRSCTKAAFRTSNRCRFLSSLCSGPIETTRGVKEVGLSSRKVCGALYIYGENLVTFCFCPTRSRRFRTVWGTRFTSPYSRSLFSICNIYLIDYPK